MDELSKLIPLLRSHGVSRFKNERFEVNFESKIESDAVAVAKDRITNAPQATNLPPDLRADDSMNEKKILEWSAPQSPQDSIEPPMPLTGDTALEG